jgi:hypothetical protein
MVLLVKQGIILLTCTNHLLYVFDSLLMVYNQLLSTYEKIISGSHCHCQVMFDN